MGICLSKLHMACMWANPCDRRGHVTSQPAACKPGFSAVQTCVETFCAGEKELHAPVTDVDPKDAVTPDNWVPRHRELIRYVCCASMETLPCMVM